MIFDFIIAIAFLWAAYRGFQKGLVYQATTLVALLLGIYGSIKFSDLLAVFLYEQFGWQSPYVKLIAFIIIFIGIILLVHLLGRFIEKMVEMVALGFVNRLIGLVFSILKTAFILSIIIYFFNSINTEKQFIPQKTIDQSLLYKPVAAVAPLLFPYLKKGIDKYEESPDKKTQDEIEDLMV